MERFLECKEADEVSADKGESSSIVEIGEAVRIRGARAEGETFRLMRPLKRILGIEVSLTIDCTVRAVGLVEDSACVGREDFC